jgi:hypothetical protein
MSAPPSTIDDAGAARHRSLADVRWFLAALRRARIVRKRLALPLKDTAAILAILAPVHPPSPETAWVAAARAARRVQRVAGGPDTCLVRALIAGSLLAARGGVRLHLGFRPGEAGGSAAGHAWLEGREFELGRDGSAGAVYDPALTVPFPPPRRNP